MRVLVTGATSLLARRTVEQLVARGDDVVVLQRHDASLDVSQVLGDVRDASAVARAMEGCDAVVHAAARVGVMGTWEEFRSVNVEGTATVLAQARRRDVARFVHVSTPSVAHAGTSVVGATADAPVADHGRAWYASSKAIAEVAATDAAAQGLPLVVLRPHLVWGPGDTQLVGRIVARARAGRLALVGDGAALVDSTYIDNAADALVAALDAVEPGAACVGQAYVIANGEPRPIRELVRGICVAAGVPDAARRIPLPVALVAGGAVERWWSLTRRRGEPPMTRFLAEQLGTAHWFDPRPARDDLRWVPQVTIDDGLARLAEWYAAGGGPTA